MYGNSEFQLGWSDLERKHGQFMVTASVKQADQISPNILSRIFALPEFGPHTLSQNKKLIEGRVAREVVNVFRDSASSSSAEPKTDSWVIDDEHGFVHGTEKEVAQIVRGEVDPFAGVPAALLADYKQAAFATVFDCKEWDKKFYAHYVGSLEQAKWAMVAPLLDGLIQLGAFVQGRGDGDLRLRAVYVDAQAALKAKEIVDGLLIVARASVSEPDDASSAADDRETRMLADLLTSIHFEQVGEELQLTMRSPQEPVFLEQCRSPIAGWLPWIDSKAKVIPNELNTVRLEGQPLGSFGGFLPQTIAAQSYLGKRVRMLAELGTHPDASGRAGLFLWTSGEQDQSLTFNSRSIDGKSSMPNQLTVMNRQDYLHDTEIKWTTIAIELNVPANSQVLSFGAYTKNADLCVRNVRFEIIGDEDGSVSTEKPWLPYNLFVVPGHEISSAPCNLDFSEQVETKSTDSEQIADKKTENAVVR